MKRVCSTLMSVIAILAVAGVLTPVPPPAAAAGMTFDITTLAGKVASLHAAMGSRLRFSALVEEQAALDITGTGEIITPSYVLSSDLDGTTIAAPDLTVNQDSAAAPQNEPDIAVDPNNPNRVVGVMNDYVQRTWTCTVNSTPCGAAGETNSGTYFSGDGGRTWCCTSSDPAHLGTAIPGVVHLAGGPYDANGDGSLAFDSRSHVYYAGVGWDRTTPPNAVVVDRGTFDAGGRLTWSAPTFINATTSPAVVTDKSWIAADSHASSPYRDRVYVSYTRVLFAPDTGLYVQSPIAFAYSTDGGSTFSTPQFISGNIVNSQGSRPVVAPDGTLYVVWYGFPALAQQSSIYVAKSTDGGVTWGKPRAIAPMVSLDLIENSVFRANGFPAAAAAANGDVYVAWSSLQSDSTGGLCPSGSNDGCHAEALFSRSTDRGATWSMPAAVLPGQDAATRTAIGYPVAQPDGSTLGAPAPRRVDTFFPGVATTPSGRVYMSAYAADVVSPWRDCAQLATPVAVGRVDCLELGNYIHNARLDYVVRDLATGVSRVVSTHPINSRYGFNGGFIGDYTDLSAGSDDVFHALWTDTNNVQTLTWFYGYEFVPTPIQQQDVVTASGNW